MSKGGLSAKALRRVADRLHGHIASSQTLSRWYLRSWSLVLRRSGGNLVKDRIVATLSAQPWPQMDLVPHRLRLGNTDLSVVTMTNDYLFPLYFARTTTYEKELVTCLLPRLSDYDAVLDIGANVGLHTMFFARHISEDGRVIAFEPSPRAFERLLQHVRLNELRNVDAFNCALADHAGVATLYEPEGHLTNGSFSEYFAESFSEAVRPTRVLCVTGTQIRELLRDRKRILVKIDAEGAEASILRGLRDWLIEARPDLVVEVLEPYDRGIAESIPFAHYRVRQITDKGLIDVKELRARPPHRDFFVEPSSAAAG